LASARGLALFSPETLAHADKTEKPTAKRRDEARKKGQVSRSPELASLFVLGASFAFLAAMGPALFGHLEAAMRDTFRQTAAPDLANGGLNRVFSTLAQTLMLVSLPFVIAVSGAGLLASVAQVRPRLVLSGLKPDFKRVSPAKGAKRIASPHSVVELVKSVAKLTVVSGVAFATLWPRKDDLASLGVLQPAAEMAFVGHLVLDLAWRILGTIAVIAVADVGWTKYSHAKSLKMSKEEVKQEHKQQDMSPQLKGRMRGRAREMARARMLGNVRKADVIVTNPTHFAVALAYRAGHNAPRVLAKGADLLAFRIRELGREHDIAIVENPPLARQLYADVEVGQEVPVQMFALVAEVLAYVWRTNRSRKYAWT
jgi:flagellar biosynthetic protein FlhB